MKRFIDNLKRQAEENPLMAIAIGTAAVAAATKLIQASTEHKNSATWAKEVERRRMNSMK